MVLTATATKSGLTDEVDFLLGTDTNQYTALDKKRNINRWYHLVNAWILAAADEWEFYDSVATSNLVANTRTYALTGLTDLLKMNRVEVSYDGVNWYKANPITREEMTVALNSGSIDGYFSTTTPRYDLRYDNMDLYPKPTASVTSGLKIYYETSVTELSADGDEPKFAEPFHRILSLGAAYDYAVKTNLAIAGALRQELEVQKQELMSYYSQRVADRETRVQAVTLNYN